MAVNFDSPTGWLGMAEALEIWRSPRSECTKFLCTVSETSCSAFLTDGANCGLLNSQSHWIVGASPVGCHL